jgi:hypothetical protein
LEVCRPEPGASLSAHALPMANVDELAPYVVPPAPTEVTVAA